MYFGYTSDGFVIFLHSSDVAIKKFLAVMGDCLVLFSVISLHDIHGNWIFKSFSCSSEFV
jgi:hypothetical protein